MRADVAVIRRYLADALATAARITSPRGRAEGGSAPTPPFAPLPVADVWTEVDAARTDLLAMAREAGLATENADEAAAYLAQVLTSPSRMRAVGMTGARCRAMYCRIHEIAETIVRVVMPRDRRACAAALDAEIQWCPSQIAAMITDLSGAPVKPGRVAMARCRGHIPTTSRGTTTLRACAAAIGVDISPATIEAALLVS